MMDQEKFTPEGMEDWHPVPPKTPEIPLEDGLQKDPMVDEVLNNPEVVSYTTISFKLPEAEGRELRPGHRLAFEVPEDFRGRIIRDVILRHRKGEKYRKDIGADGYDPYGAYSRVEVHDEESDKWRGWQDPKGYSPDKFAEPRSSGDPENEVLHDWLATVGPIRPDSLRVTNVGRSEDFSVSQVHGVEVVFFPELENVSYQERVYTPGTEFIDIEKGKTLPKYGGGSHTEGVYQGAIALNHSGAARYELGKDPGEQAELRNGDLRIDLQSGQELVQVEVAVGDTENLDHINPKTGRNTRLGYAKLWVGIERAGNGQTDWFIKNANIPPQGVSAGGPLLEQSKIKPGDKLVVEARSDAAFVMGWRLAYKEQEQKVEE